MLKAQDTVTVMQYNLLQYGNYQGYGGCSETTNNTQDKDEAIRTILDYVKPDILTVCEFGATQNLMNDFLRHNLNDGVNYWKTDNIINYQNSNLINHIFYDSRKMELKKHVALRTYPRDTDVYELYLKTPGLIAGDTIKLVCVVAHPKAGNSSTDMTQRQALMNVVMAYVSQHYADENVLFMGDFNLYRATESAYQLVTKTYSDNEARFVDPMLNEGGVGDWNNNSRYARFHTQSTRTEGSCFSSGGLDDRFDFILMSDEVIMGEKSIRYIEHSYKAVGNDGYHFNKSINQNGNSAVPADVAQALYDCSDHLPVSMKMRVFVPLGVDENAVAQGFRVYPNPAGDVLHVDVVGAGEYQIINVMGQVLMAGRVDGEMRQIDVSGLLPGMYFITIDGASAKFIKGRR